MYDLNPALGAPALALSVHPPLVHQVNADGTSVASWLDGGVHVTHTVYANGIEASTSTYTYTGTDGVRFRIISVLTQVPGHDPVLIREKFTDGPTPADA